MVFSARLNVVKEEITRMEEEGGEEGAFEAPKKHIKKNSRTISLNTALEHVELNDLFSPTKIGHELNVFNDFVPRVRFGVLRDAATTTLVRLFEHVAVLHWHADARQLLKSPYASGIRKAARYSDPFVVAPKMFLSTLKNQFFFWTASFFVSSGIDVWIEYGLRKRDASTTRYSSNALSRFAHEYVSKSMSIALSDKRNLKLMVAVVNNGIRCAFGLLFASAGGTIGTMLLPGRGTYVGVLVGPPIGVALTASIRI